MHLTAVDFREIFVADDEGIRGYSEEDRTKIAEKVRRQTVRVRITPCYADKIKNGANRTTCTVIVQYYVFSYNLSKIKNWYDNTSTA